MISQIIFDGKEQRYELKCPIRDSESCRNELVEGKRGEFFYWRANDYRTFILGFLRSESLVGKFIDSKELEDFDQSH